MVASGHFIMRRAVPVLLLAHWATACSSPPSPQDESGLWIDALLSFTGEQSAGVASYERAMILAQETVNDGGASYGRLQIREQDTHSSVTRGLTAAEQAIADGSVLALVGPDDAQLINAMVPLVGPSGMAQMLPGITVPALGTSASSQWFRILPTGDETGCAWAQRMYDDGVNRIVVLQENDDPFDATLAAAVAKVFTESAPTGQQAATIIGFDASGADGALPQAYALGPDAVVLIADAAVGAAVVSNWSGPSNQPLTWYFSPSLGTNGFLDNTVFWELEGMTGIAPAPPEETSAAFEHAYSRRWAGDSPTIGAYAYYDAVAILGLALESAALEAGGVPTRAQVRDHIVRVSSPPGVAVQWNEIGKGLALLRQGQKVNYQGASGPVDLTSSGAIDPSISLFRIWAIDGDQIVPTDYATCAWLTGQ
jgi:ABC-type branched-subunit amino acid transport system substrate-binding protein